MIDISKFKNKDIIVCENGIKNRILRNLSDNKLLINLRFYTKKAFFEQYYFSYDKRALYHLVKNYNLNIQVAKEYLSKLIFIEDKKYKNSKLNYLNSIKKDLIDNNLLIYDKYFKDNISKIYVIGYDYLELFEEKLFKKLNAEIVNFNNKFYEHKVYKFDTLEEEVNYIAHYICTLINDGIDINKIKLLNVSEDYFSTIKRIFNFYKIPTDLYSNNLFSTKICKIFLDNYSNDLNLALDKIKNMNSTIVNKIINICNKYSFINDKLEIKNLIIDDLKNTTYSLNNLKNSIKIVDFCDISDDDYAILLNFNNSSIPRIVKDEDYITDNIKEELDLYKTYEVNKKIKDNTINNIKSIKNLIITYKLKSNSKEFYPSVLISDMNLEVEEKNMLVRNSFSIVNDKVNFARRIDNLIKFGEYDKSLELYNNTYSIDYKSYDNKFKGINKNDFYDYMKGKLTLSYTSIDAYNKCAFRYYVKNILKLEKMEETFMTFVGSLFHYVLEKCLDGSDVDKTVLEFTRDKLLSAKEKFFIKKLTEEIKFVIQVINEQLKSSSLDKCLTEEEVFINKGKNIKIIFKGFVDKILYKETDENVIAALIDYKTGDTSIDLKYVSYGLGLQLPIYLYLTKNSKLKNVKFAGFYLQKIFNNEVSIETNKTYLEQKRDKLKLQGYSTSNIKNLSYFDKNYTSSNMIQGLKVNSNGEFYKYSKVLSDNEIDNLIDITSNKIEEAIDFIEEAKFNINPKRIGFIKNVGCSFCKYKDICFMTDKDFIDLDEVSNLDFLKGDSNA